MKTIEYRAKSEMGNRWVYGMLYSADCKIIDCIKPYDGLIININPKTLGELFPLKVENKKIYEGDVLKFTKHRNYTLDSFMFLVCFDEKQATWGYKVANSPYPDVIHPFCEHDELEQDFLNHCKLIGNIFDNQKFKKLFCI